MSVWTHVACTHEVVDSTRIVRRVLFQCLETTCDEMQDLCEWSACQHLPVKPSRLPMDVPKQQRATGDSGSTSDASDGR